MKINSLSDIGSTRSENQDNYWSAILKVDDIETGVVCMCDGMGGLKNGGLASKIIVDMVRESILNGTALNNLVDVLESANQTIFNMSDENIRMGSTCSILCCRNGEYTVHHIGDSRCYQITVNGRVRQISTDHSVINQYGITKENSPELYEKYKSKLTRCIGVKPEIEVDIYRGRYDEGDSFLLCSDGFWHCFEESGFNFQLVNLKECIQTCMNMGETDNISVSILYT